MSGLIATSAFQSRVDYLQLPAADLHTNIDTARAAFRHFYHLWQEAVRDSFGDELAREYTAMVYFSLSTDGGDLDAVFLMT